MTNVNFHQDRDIRESYLYTVKLWIKKESEVFVDCQYLRSAGKRDYVMELLREMFPIAEPMQDSFGSERRA